MYVKKYSRKPIMAVAELARVWFKAFKTKVWRLRHHSTAALFSALILTALPAVPASVAIAQPSVIRHITESTERLELMVNSSRILTLEKPIPRMVVNNPEMLSVIALGPNQVQIAAKKTGVTQINFWDEDENV